MYNRIILFIVLTLTSLFGFAQNIDLDGFGRIEVNGRLGYIRDPELKLTIFWRGNSVTDMEPRGKGLPINFSQLPPIPAIPE